MEIKEESVLEGIDAVIDTSLTKSSDRLTQINSGIYQLGIEIDYLTEQFETACDDPHYK